MSTTTSKTIKIDGRAYTIAIRHVTEVNQMIQAGWIGEAFAADGTCIIRNPPTAADAAMRQTEDGLRRFLAWTT